MGSIKVKSKDIEIELKTKWYESLNFVEYKMFLDFCLMVFGKAKLGDFRK